jgi:hypothetical protein
MHGRVDTERPMRKITIEQEWRQQSEAAKNEAQNFPTVGSAMLSYGRPGS